MPNFLPRDKNSDKFWVSLLPEVSVSKWKCWKDIRAILYLAFLHNEYLRYIPGNTELPYSFSHYIVLVHHGHMIISFINFLLASGFQSFALAILAYFNLHTHPNMCCISSWKNNSQVKNLSTSNLTGIVKLSSRGSNHYGPHQQCAREPCQFCAAEKRMNCISLLTFAFSYEVEHNSHLLAASICIFFSFLCLLVFPFLIWRHCIYQRTEPLDLTSLSICLLSWLFYRVLFFFFSIQEIFT